jgi:sugar lactone lactonase YvrE
VIASGQTSPAYVAVDATQVYWTNVNSGQIMKAGKDGGAVTELANGQTVPFSIAVGAAGVFWTNTVSPGSVNRVAKEGGPVTVVAANEDGPRGLTLDEGHVYWGNQGTTDGTVKRALFDGSGVEVLSGQQATIRDMVLLGDHVYWAATDAGNLAGTLATGGAGLDLVVTGQPNPHGVATDGVALYFTTHTDTGTVVRVVPGGAPTVLASMQGAPRSVVVDDRTVYWTNEDDGKVQSTPIASLADGSRPIRTLASSQSAPFGIAMDRTAIYWAARNAGLILKLAK